MSKENACGTYGENRIIRNMQKVLNLLKRENALTAACVIENEVVVGEGWNSSVLNRPFPSGHPEFRKMSIDIFYEKLTENDEIFLQLAQTFSTIKRPNLAESENPKAAAFVVNKNDMEIYGATSYYYCPYDPVSAAVLNAYQKGHKDLSGCILYSSQEPSLQSIRLIAQSHIKTVVIPNKLNENYGKFAAKVKILRECDIKIRCHLTKSDLSESNEPSPKKQKLSNRDNSNDKSD